MSSDVEPDWIESDGPESDHAESYRPDSDRPEADQPDSDRRRGRASSSAFRQADRYVAVGFQVALSLVLYLLVGYWLDGFLDTEPWLMLAGAVLGFVSMIFLVVRFANQQSRPRSDKAPGDASGSAPGSASGSAPGTASGSASGSAPDNAQT